MPKARKPSAKLKGELRRRRRIRELRRKATKDIREQIDQKPL